VSYPALLVVGLSALTANVTNLVALVACWPGSAVTSRAELSGNGRWLKRGLPIAAAGGAAGALLLLHTTPGTFARVVPFLVAAGSLVLLAQPRLTALRERRGKSGQSLTFAVLGLVAVYGGYFGAGSGVMVLALLLVLLDPRLPHANAVKNMAVGANTLAAAIVLALAGPVDWAAVGPLAAGLFAGSVAGPVVARRLPARVIRWAVAALGFALAIDLLVNPSG
jgi:uncharacterized membrane protein YfcA